MPRANRHSPSTSARPPSSPVARFLLDTLCRLAASLSPNGRRRLAAALAEADRALSAGRREGLRSNLGLLAAWGHPRARTPAGRASLERSIFRSYHLGVLEYAAAMGAAPGRTRLCGTERLYRALAAGRGAVVTAPHLGGWETAGLVLARLGFRIHVVTGGVQYHAAVTGAVRGRKEASRIAVSTPADGFLPLLATLRAGGLVVLLADGDVARRSIPVRFFGAAARLPAGPALLARRARAPIVHAYATREPGAAARIVFDSSDAPDPSLPLDRDLARLTEGVARALERAIAARPEEWCIFRPFADRVAAPPAAARVEAHAA